RPPGLVAGVLDVVMAVDQDRGGVLPRGAQLAHHQRRVVALGQLGGAAGGDDPAQRPLGGGAQRLRVAARGADGRDPQPAGQLVDRAVEVGHSDLMTARVSPAVTEPPSVMGSSAIVPALWAKISFSIFIASMMQTSAPSSTWAPFSTSTFQTLPCSGEG